MRIFFFSLLFLSLPTSVYAVAFADLAAVGYSGSKFVYLDSRLYYLTGVNRSVYISNDYYPGVCAPAVGSVYQYSSPDDNNGYFLFLGAGCNEDDPSDLVSPDLPYHGISLRCQFLTDHSCVPSDTSYDYMSLRARAYFFSVTIVTKHIYSADGTHCRTVMGSTLNFQLVSDDTCAGSDAAVLDDDDFDGGEYNDEFDSIISNIKLISDSFDDLNSTFSSDLQEFDSSFWDFLEVVPSIDVSIPTLSRDLFDMESVLDALPLWSSLRTSSVICSDPRSTVAVQIPLGSGFPLQIDFSPYQSILQSFGHLLYALCCLTAIYFGMGD